MPDMDVVGQPCGKNRFLITARQRTQCTEPRTPRAVRVEAGETERRHVQDDNVIDQDDDVIDRWSAGNDYE